MTTNPDPWASTDHDPTSTGGPTQHTANITTRRALMLAAADLHDALAQPDDGPRHQYAASAGDYARMVLHAPDATAGQREIAGYYLIDAEILTNN
ncbi:hypothetical protein JHV675_08790 [Mycobacterium avium subsp. hominissuis]